MWQVRNIKSNKIKRVGCINMCTHYILTRIRPENYILEPAPTLTELLTNK